MASKPFNVGVVGYGMSAKIFHIPLVESIPDFKLYAIVQRHPKPADDAKQDHPGSKSYRSTEELVKDEEVDVVVVTTVPDTHVELTKLALENGKHVIVEKPFAPTSREADELIDLAKKQQRLLTVYQNRRYDTDFLTLLALIRSNCLGRIATFETHFDRHRPSIPAASTWKTRPVPGGGAIYDLGTHLIDQVVVAFGLPKQVTGFVGSQREGDTGGYEDSCMVLLHYESMMATVRCSVVSPEEKQLRYWVRGTEGSYKKHYLDIQEEQLKGGTKPGGEGFGLEPEARSGTLTTLQDGTPVAKPHPNITPLTYAAFYTQFAKALRGESDIPVEPKDASAVIRLIELALQSSKEGRTMNV